MKCVRLFVGGLDDSIDNQLLTSKLSKYGRVSEIELKEKKDAEGNVSFRFAYINIEAAPSQIEECVSQLNGSLWSGSRLRVEVAKESFLDRLKRERAKTQEQKQQPSLPSKSESPRKLQKLTSSNFHEVSHSDNKQVETGGEKKRKSSLQEYDTPEAQRNRSMSFDEDVKSLKKKKKSSKKNEAEEEMMASFKTFSSVWADSDEEDVSQQKKSLGVSKNKTVQQDHHKHTEVITKDESDSSDEDSDDSDEHNLNEDKKSLPVQDKRQNWGNPSGGSRYGTSEGGSPYKTMTRYDPTRPEHHQFRILPSSQSKEDEQRSESHQEPEDVNSGGFSFLKIFDELQQNEFTASTPAKRSSQSIIKEPVHEAKVDRFELNSMKEKEHIPIATAHVPFQKSRSFFFKMNDDRIQEGLEWMMQNDQYHIIPEYQAVEPDLYNVIKTRSKRAKREAKKERIENDNKRKSNKHKDTEISVTEDQYYDYAWRRAVQLEEARKSRGRGHLGAPHKGQEGEYNQNQERNQSRDSSYGCSFGGGNNFNRGRGRGNYVSFRGRGDNEARGRGRGNNQSWGRGREDAEVFSRGRMDKHSWSRGRGINKDHVTEEGSDCLTRS